MANCMDCNSSYFENITDKWECKKGHRVRINKEGYIDCKKIKCEDFKKEKW